MEYAQRMKKLGTETAFEVLARAKELERNGKKVVHLEIGEPDFDTPGNISEAAIAAIRGGFTHYGPSPGLVDFRTVVAEKAVSERGLQVDYENVVITPGGKPILFFTILACVDPGDEVIYPNPGFPIYESVVDFIGAKPVPLHLKEERDFRFDLGELKKLINSKTKMIILNSPHNPTGGILTEEDLAGIVELVKGKDIWILADEIYCKIIYEGHHKSIATYPGMQEKTIVLDGFSKTYAMTGWRLGYGIMEKKLALHIARLMTNCNSCTCTFTQKAGIEALNGPQDAVKNMVAEFKKRRDVIVSGLNKIEGVSCKLPKGAFYVFPNVSKLTDSSADFARRLLDESGVAALSGTSFGSFGEGYLRFSYANSIENINAALAQLTEFADSYRKTVSR